MTVKMNCNGFLLSRIKSVFMYIVNKIKEEIKVLIKIH